MKAFKVSYKAWGRDSKEWFGAENKEICETNFITAMERYPRPGLNLRIFSIEQAYESGDIVIASSPEEDESNGKLVQMEVTWIERGMNPRMGLKWGPVNRYQVFAASQSIAKTNDLNEKIVEWKQKCYIAQMSDSYAVTRSEEHAATENLLNWMQEAGITRKNYPNELIITARQYGLTDLLPNLDISEKPTVLGDLATVDCGL